MHELVADYAKNKGIEIPEDYKRMAELMSASDIPHFYLDMRGVGTHHFLAHQYQMLNPKQTNTKDWGKFGFKSIVVRRNENVFVGANKKFSYHIEEQWGIKKSLVIAVANNMRDRDTGLFYLFDDQGKAEGLYACSINLIEQYGKVPVEQCLDDIFVIPELSEIEAQGRLQDRYRFTRKNPQVPMDKIESKASPHFELIDRKMGGVDGYKRLFQIFESRGNGKFNPTSADFSENATSVLIDFELNGEPFKAELNKEHDLIDDSIAATVNGAMAKTMDRVMGHFLLYYHPDYPTKVMVIYSEDSKVDNFLNKTGYLSWDADKI